MDCRNTLLPALWLLTGALGCATNRTPTAQPMRETPPPPLASSAYNPSRIDGPKRTPLPATCVQAGSFFAGEALSLDKGSSAQEQMLDKARKAYQQAIAIDQNHLPAYQGLAHLYAEMEDYDHAVATYRRALQIQPRNGSVWFDLGMCLARRKDWPTSLDALSHAVECDPENRQYVNTYGFALARAGQYQASLNTFRRVNNEAMSNYQLARMLHHLQQDDLSRRCVVEALQKDPNLEPAQSLWSELNQGSAPNGAVQPASNTVEAAPQ